MVIGYYSSSSLGFGAARSYAAPSLERNTLTLDAKLDPKKPNEYSVDVPKPVITPPEKTSEAKNANKRTQQNTDPVSRAFDAVASYEAKIYRIDVFV